MAYQISFPASIDATATSGGAAPASADDPALELALGMAGLGYTPIAVAAQDLVGVPLKAGSKDYRPKDPVGAWKSATADEADIRRRFAYALRVGDQHATVDGPAIAVGLRTDGMCIIDLDSAKADAVKAAAPERREHAHRMEAIRLLHELLIVCGETDEVKRRQLIAWMMQQAHVRTASGGRHFWFQVPEGVDIKSDTNTLGVKLVDIRGSGGYAMAPRSVLADGRTYQPMRMQKRADGHIVPVEIDEWPSRDLLPLLPEPLLSKLPRARARALVAGTPAVGGASRRGRGTTYAGVPMQDFLPLDAKALVEALAWWPAEGYGEWRTVRTALIRRADDERLDRPCCSKLAFEIFRAWAATTTNNSFSEDAAVAEWGKGLERLYDASGNEVKGIEAGTLIERMTQARTNKDGKAKHAAGRRRGRIEVELYNSAVRLAATDLDLAWQIGDVIEHWKGSSAVPPLPPRPGTAALASVVTGAAATVGNTSTAVTAPVKVPLPRSGDPGLIAVRWHERDDDGKVPPTRQNIAAALAHWGLTLKLNTFSGDVDAFGCADFDVLDDDGLNQLHQNIVEAGMVINDRKFRDALSSIVWERRYNPVTEYIDNLVWDGKPRVDRALTMYFKVEDAPLTRGFSKAFFIAAVRRARRPGTKHDCMLVFESGQGAGKSSGLAVLVPDSRWFTDSVELGADPKLMIERTRGSWLVEIAELSGRRDQVERVKTQLSATTDKARLAFGRLAKQVPRAFVMTGSINPNVSQQYLMDETGGRRFWPVACTGEVDVAGIIRDRSQLWAEAAHREARGEPHVLDRSLWAAAAVEQEKRRVKGGIEEALIDAFGHITDGAILSTDVFGLVGLGNGHSGGPKPPTQAQSAQVEAAMSRMGWEQRRRQSPLRPPNETPRIWIKGSGAPWLWVSPGTTEVKPAATVNQAGGRPVP